MPKESPAPKPYKIEYNPDGSRKLRSIVAIIADLSKPIEKRLLSQKPADRTGNVMLTFIPWYRAVQYLDFYAPGWTSYVRYEGNPGGNVVVVVGVTIPCLEKPEGVTREATGQEKEKVSGFGDSTSNAESMAFRRAAAKFGLGLYLYYDKD